MPAACSSTPRSSSAVCTSRSSNKTTTTTRTTSCTRTETSCTKHTFAVRIQRFRCLDRLLLFALVLLLLLPVPSLAFVSHSTTSTTTLVPANSVLSPLCSSRQGDPNSRYRWKRCTSWSSSASSNEREMSTSLPSHPTGSDQETRASSSKDAATTDAGHNVAPMYITIGPPCAGKTTWLRSTSGGGTKQQIPTVTTAATATTTTTTTTTTATAAANGIPIRDVCIDDQEGVYVPVDTALFLDLPVADKEAQGEEKVSSSSPLPLPSLSLFGQTVQQRIAAPDQAELVAILQRCAGQLSAEHFAARIQGLYSNNQRSGGRNNNRNNNNSRNNNDQ
jgi:hypothetical protein